MGLVKGVRAGPKIHICRRCGEPILFQHRAGFIVKGQPRYYPVNADDGRPHSSRCKLKMELKELRSRPRGRPKRTTPQGELL